MDVAAGDGVLFSVVYAAAGLLSGQFCKHRRGFFLSTFAAAYLLALFCVPLPALRILIIDVVLVRFHLGDLLVRDVEPQRLLGARQRRSTAAARCGT